MWHANITFHIMSWISLKNDIIRIVLIYYLILSYHAHLYIYSLATLTICWLQHIHTAPDRHSHRRRHRHHQRHQAIFTWREIHTYTDKDKVTNTHIYDLHQHIVQYYYHLTQSCTAIYIVHINTIYSHILWKLYY